MNAGRPLTPLQIAAAAYEIGFTTAAVGLYEFIIKKDWYGAKKFLDDYYDKMGQGNGFTAHKVQPKDEEKIKNLAKSVNNS